EQGLISELLEFIAEGSHKVARSNDTMILQNSYSISGKQISGTLFHNNDMTSEDDLIPDSSPYLAHSFSKAEKTGRKEKLRWYCYSEKCEKKVSTLSSENNISDQMARTQNI
ncbi:189_t:CDS:1, partial [Diversispora eburnea]